MLNSAVAGPVNARRKSRAVLNVCVLSDGRPGHVSQSLGLADALNTRWCLRIEIAECRVRRPILRKLLRFAARFEWATDRVIASYTGMDRLPDADLIISTGGDTAMLNAVLARKLQCANIFTGRLRGMPPALFTARCSLLTADHPGDVQLRVVPSRVTHQSLAAHRERSARRQGAGRELCLLLGGDGVGYTYGDDDWTALAGQLNRLGQQGCRFRIASSRRTCIAARRILSSDVRPEFVLDTAWYDEDATYRTPEFLAKSNGAICTEDSLSQINEGMAAFETVTTIRPAKVNIDRDYEGLMQLLASRNDVSRQWMHDVIPVCSAEATDWRAQLLDDFLWLDGLVARAR